MSLRWNILMFAVFIAHGQELGPLRDAEEQRSLQRIRETPSSDKVHFLREAVDCVGRPDDPEHHAVFLNSAFDALYAGGLTDRHEASRVEQECVLAALDWRDSLSALTEARLTLRLRVSPSVLSASARLDAVRKVDLIFHSWRKLESETIVGFDFAHEPRFSVSPPMVASRQLLVSGMDPATIRDPSIRSEYQQAIAQNRSHAAEYSRQVQLRSIRVPFARHAENLLSAAVRLGAVTEAEVGAGLSLLRDDEIRQRVLAKIRLAAR